MVAGGGVGATQAVYVLVFGIGGLGCLLGAVRARRFSHHDTRIGLSSLLVLCGAWSAGTGVRLLVPDPSLSRTILLFELMVGLAAVGAWLYFASAYTGQPYHRERLFRWTAVGVFLVLTAVKFTNPIHGLYLTATVATDPFPHLVITDYGLHLAVTGIAYALSAIGFYVLFEMLSESRVDTRKLSVPVVLAGVPVVFNVLGQIEFTGVLPLSYEPIGVAAFGIGVLFFTESTFERARWTQHQRILDELNEVVIFVDNESRVRDFNAAAERVFPALVGSTGSPLNAVCPAVAETIPGAEVAELAQGGEPRVAPYYDVEADAGLNLIELTSEGEQRYYAPSVGDIVHDSTSIGQAIICLDVTTVERQRRELRRQNDQLDGFASAVAHELRNTLLIIDGNLNIIWEELTAKDTGLLDTVRTSLQTSERMLQIIDDLTTLARYAQTVEDPPGIDFRETLSGVPIPGLTHEVSIDIEGEGRIRADPQRVREILRQAARLAAATDGTHLAITLDDTGLTLETDGTPLPEGKAVELFTYGTAVPNAYAGMIGANIQAIARAHGWDTSADTGYRDGIRIRISGLQPA